MTVSRGRSAYSGTSLYFPPFSSQLGIFEKQKGPFPHCGEVGVSFKAGLWEGEKCCSGGQGLRPGPGISADEHEIFPTGCSQESMLGIVCWLGRLHQFLQPTGSISVPLCPWCYQTLQVTPLKKIVDELKKKKSVNLADLISPQKVFSNSHGSYTHDLLLLGTVTPRL